MKYHIWIALLLAIALTAPAYAQQDTNTNPQDQQNPPAATQTAPDNTQQNAPSTQQTTNPQQPAGQQNAADQNLGAHQPLQAERHEGFWGKINPFARKKYVQRQMQPIRDRVNELDELTASNSKAIKDVDARAQEGIRLASAKASEADQHAVQAGNTAQQANQTAQQASTRLNTVQQVVSNIDQYQPATQTEIRLRPGQATLSKKAKDALDQMVEPVKGKNGYIVEVQGFSSGSGQAAIENSQHMAQSVVRYLVLNHDIPVYRIYLLGMGNAPVPATTEGAKPRRTTRGGRVEVSLLKNSLEQLGTFGEAAPASGTTQTQGGISGTSTQPQQSVTQQPSMNAPAEQPAANPNAPAPKPQPESQPPQR